MINKVCETEDVHINGLTLTEAIEAFQKVLEARGNCEIEADEPIAIWWTRDETKQEKVSRIKYEKERKARIAEWKKRENAEQEDYRKLQLHNIEMRYSAFYK